MLKRRTDLFNEEKVILERLAKIKNDVKALDKTRRLVGYDGEQDAIMPRQKRNVMSGSGELIQAIMLELLCATGSLRSCEIAQNILAKSSEDILDRRAVSNLTRRISQTLCKARDKGSMLWQMDGSYNLSWFLQSR